MKFTMVYNGRLSASGNKPKTKEAAEIRSQFSKQLDVLWSTHHALKILQEEAWVQPHAPQRAGFSNTPSGVVLVEGQQLSPRKMAEMMPDQFVSLSAPICVGSHQFRPLIRETLNLNCELSVLFLRQGDPGALVNQGGDIDNRIKTLLDALRMPTDQEVGVATPSDEHQNVLMQSDTLVSRLNINTDRLLFPQSNNSNEVHLVIEVTVKVLRVTSMNTCLL